MERLLAMLLALIVGAGGAYGFDRHPPIGWHLNLLFWHPGFSLAPSLAEQRDQAVAASVGALRDLKTCRANTDALKAASDAQERAVAALRAQSAAWVAQGRSAVSAANSEADRWKARADAIAAEKPSSPDLCKAAEQVLREGEQ